MLSQLERPILKVVSEIPADVAEVFDMAAGLSERGYSVIKGGDEYRVYKQQFAEEEMALGALCQVVTDRLKVIEVKAAHLQVVRLSDKSEMQLSLYRDSAAAVNLCEYDTYLIDHFRRVA